jgi:4-amino-4-deoxy-L-arabinose transferase-like glycosyltransferase
MATLFHHRGWHYLLLIAVGALMFFLNLGGATLWDVDEGRNSSCALEMMEASNWIVPTFNGKLRIDKPVLLYWLQIYAYQTFGISEFAARVPSALAALATVLLTYELARSMFRRTTGLIASVIVSTTPMLCGAARFANPDALLNCFTVSTLAIFWFGLARRPWWWFALLGISAGLAVLAKGPVGIVLPGAVATLFLVWQREWRVAWDRRWFIAFWCFAATALPWYVWVGIETKGEFLAGFLWRHNVERGMSAMENHNGFPGYYVIILLVGTMPWSIFLPAAWWYGAWSTVRSPWTRTQSWWTSFAEPTESNSAIDDRTAAYRLLACWIVVYLAFFSLAATKLPNYALPTVAPCAILVGRFLRRWQASALTLPGWFTSTGVISLLAIGLALFIGLNIVGGVGELAFLRGRFFRGLEWWSIIGAVPIVAAVLGWWFVRKRQPERFVVALSVSAILLLAPLAAFGSVLFNRYKAPRALTEQADLLRRDEDIRIGGWHMEHLPSLNFYVQRNVEHLQEESDLSQFLSYDLRVYLIMPTSDWERLEPSLRSKAREVGRQYDFYHHGDAVVVTNR